MKFFCLMFFNLYFCEFIVSAQDTTWFRPIHYMSTPAVQGVWLDVNADGRQDIITQTLTSRHLFINQGTDVFLDSISNYMLDMKHSMGGSTMGDINNDGWIDFYATPRDNLGSIIGSCHLFINSRGGDFFEITEPAGLSKIGTGETSVLFDLEGDGDLDIFATFNHTDGSGAYLYRNDGFQFTEILDKTGLARSGWLEGAQALDFNGDGFIDLTYGSKLFLNSGDGTFLDANNGMWPYVADEGICFADLNNDGKFELIHNASILGTYKIVVFKNENNYLYNWTDSIGISDSLLANHWGVTAVDLDNDGLKDLMIGGQPEIGLAAPFLALRNKGNYQFEDVTEKWNLKFAGDQAYSNMLAPADYDNDGHMDFFLVGNRSGYKIWHNESTDSNYLNIRVTGQNGQLNQFGARITLKYSYLGRSSIATDFVGSGPGYAVKGQYDNHFGIPSQAIVDIEALFPSAVGNIIRIDKTVNPVLSQITPSTMGGTDQSRTVEIRRNGDVIINSILYPAVNPPVVTLTYPINSSYYRPNSDSLVELKWKDFNGASSYDLQYASTSRFDSGAVHILNTAIPKCSVALNEYKQVFWRVRANTLLGPTAWSEPFCLIVDSIGLPFKNYYSNSAPINITAMKTEAFEDSFFTTMLSALDSDDSTDNIGFVVMQAPNWVSFDSSSHSLSGTPAGRDVKDIDTLVVSCFDNRGGYTVNTYFLRINHVNHSPVFLSQPDTTAKEGSIYTYYAYAHDADSLIFKDILRFQLVNSPVWLSIDSITGTVTGRPTVDDTGKTIVRIKAFDDHGSFAFQSYTLMIANNKIPDSVHLIHPPKEETLTLYRNPIPRKFLWSQSTDLDQVDTLSYIFRVYGHGLDTTFCELKDTAITLNGEIFQEDARYVWFVLPTDGIAINFAVDSNEFFTTKRVLNPELIPKKYALNSSYPNPFNPATTIRFALPEKSFVELEIYNVLGQRIVVLSEGEFEADQYEVQWRPEKNLASGVYIILLRAKSLSSKSKISLSRKITLLK